MAPYLWVLAPILALATNVAAQIVLFRGSRGTHFMRSIIGGFLAGLIALALLVTARMALEGFAAADLATALLVDAPSYGALSYCFYNFVQLGQTSVRIRLYTEIAKRADGLQMRDIELLYNEEALMRARVDRLLESGDIMERNGRCVIGKRRLVIVAAVISAAKHLLLKRGSEFAAPPAPSSENS